jgi:hypothetical protein
MNASIEVRLGFKGEIIQLPACGADLIGIAGIANGFF